MLAAPPTRYARSGEARIAFQVIGDGPPDVAMIGGPASHLDLQWEDPETARSRRRYGSFARAIFFDRRGTGLSDPVDRLPSLDLQMDDLDAVLDAVGVERVALIGAVEGGLCAMYAATHPDRVTALVLINVAGSGTATLGDERRAQILDLIENHWGEGRFAELYAPEQARDQRFADWWARFERACVSPLMARRLVDLNAQADVTDVLPAIRVPTLVLIRRDNPLVPVAAARAAASLIPDARVVEADGADLYNWPGADDPEMDLIEELLTGRRPERGAERVLASVLFTDIVGSTEHAAQIGDRAWRDMLDRHHAIVRELLDHFRGREIKTLGDGFVATFDRPAAAVRCAQEIVEQVDALGLSVRCGLHTGECELLDGDVGGIAVHISARVNALARGGEVLVSGTVKDLVVGSDLDFDDRGPHDLRGVPGEWRLYAVSN
ncbi:MAG TPA: adenylate/guanylate cyclase domain-containing protein [Thermoleophilaceae bacterium]|nr:adenylate/guanylate cyclase domain-containing protein [Thermoleophilaceae bacterium]